MTDRSRRVSSPPCRRRSVPRRRSPWAGVALALPAAALVVGCNSSGSGSGGNGLGNCLTDEEQFAVSVWEPVLGPNCTVCHNPQGLAKDSAMVYIDEDQPGAMGVNLNTFARVAGMQQGGESIMLLKPTERVVHEGGKQLEVGDANFEALRSMITWLDDPNRHACSDDPPVDTPPGDDPPIDDPPVDTPPVTDGECITNEDFFAQQLWRPLLKPNCSTCHNIQGAARQSDLVFTPQEVPGALEKNYEVFANVAELERSGVSVVLLKPTADIEHGGGKVIEKGSVEYEALQEMVTRLKAPPVVCRDVGNPVDEVFEDVELLTPAQTLRRAALSLAGRLPTDDEIAFVDEFELPGLEPLVERMTREEGFYDLFRERLNDVLLTDRYLGRNNAVDLLDRDYYPMARWYREDNALEMAEGDSTFLQGAADFSNNAVAREPIELAIYLLRNDRPFREFLTADYVMVNPFSARVYGITDIEWDNPYDPSEYRPGRVENLPHAGVLTSPMFLNRYPTTDTNRNRHRSRIVYQYFLDTDVLNLSDRPIDPTSTLHNPTMNDPQCTVCHATVDPVAGAFQHWDTRGSYIPRESWIEGMRSPGFGEVKLPFEERTASLSWLAHQITSDQRFDYAMVSMVWRMLIGRNPMSAPSDDVPADSPLRTAFEVQRSFFDKVAREFRANDHDLRVILKRIIRSPWYRARSYANPMDDEQAQVLGELGIGLLLTPEQLHRKLQETTGYPWRRRSYERDYLLDTREYFMLYGGIDSVDVIERIREPNGVMSSIQIRMANEMACRTTARDFSRFPEDRRLFPFVERTYVPEDDNGFAIEGAVQAIRKNIQYLHWRVLGERLALDDPEIERAYELWDATWREGREKVAEDVVDDALMGECRSTSDYWTGASLPDGYSITYDRQYTVRAWMAVMTYLLMDPTFLYE